ncbi:DUF982 domain-containing protein [Mesorhizobium sp. M1340]|uniref:DUF982 domain-containing protein n=1 Tax=Mesorhizobium sp. M1340 TaxID=2957087 RepID=UPI0033383053
MEEKINGWFYPPVPVRGDRPSIRYNVNNATAAGEQLLKWTKRGPMWNKAVRVCVAVLAGELPAEDARTAFEAAAEEEGKLLPPND